MEHQLPLERNVEGKLCPQGSPRFCLRTGPQTGVPNAAASASPKNLMEMQILGPYRRPNGSGVGPLKICVLTNILGDSGKTQVKAHVKTETEKKWPVKSLIYRSFTEGDRSFWRSE